MDNHEIEAEMLIKTLMEKIQKQNTELIMYEAIVNQLKKKINELEKNENITNESN